MGHTRKILHELSDAGHGVFEGITVQVYVVLSRRHRGIPRSHELELKNPLYRQHMADAGVSVGNVAGN